jgi:MFS family permease
MRKPKLWTKDFIMISCTNFFVHVVFYLLMTTIAMYVMTAYHASSSVAGITVGIFVIAALLARVLAGKYLDKIGWKRSLVGALFMLMISMLLHFFTNNLEFLLVIRFIQGAAHGFLTTAAGAIAAELIPDERRGEGTGYYATSMNLAMAIGPFIGILMSEHASFKMIVLVGSIVSIMGLMSALFIQIPKIKPAEQRVRRVTLKDYIEPKAIPISFVLLIVTIAYSSLLSFVSLYAKGIDLVNESSFFFIVYAAALLISRPITGRWFDKYGENRVTYPLIGCLAIGFFLLSIANNGVVFLFSGSLIGIGYGTLLSNFQAIAIQQSPPYRKALATSTFFMFLDLANGVGPYLMGVFFVVLSFRSLYLTVAIWILIVCTGIYYAVHGKKAFVKSISVN